MTQWFKSTVMTLCLILLHWHRVTGKLHAYERTSMPARPLGDEPDWIVGMTVRIYDGQTAAVCRFIYAVAVAEWVHRSAERKGTGGLPFTPANQGTT